MKENLIDLKWHVPPGHSEKIVVGYATDGESVFRHRFDRSDGSLEIAVSKKLKSDAGRYWQAAPPNLRWRIVERMTWKEGASLKAGNHCRY
jgi:hypothetical protein